MWLYLQSTAEVDFNNHARFEGVVYGASDAPNGGAQIQAVNHAEVFGALIGDVTKVPNHARVHYDEALAKKNAFTTSSSAAPVRFVRFSQQTAAVDD